MILAQEKNIKLIMHFLTWLSFFILIFFSITIFYIPLIFYFVYKSQNIQKKYPWSCVLSTIHLDNYSNLESLRNKNLNAILV